MDNNVYDEFINHLKSCEYGEGTKLEKHRILPQHAGGSYKQVNNVILCSFENHRLAHYYRFLTHREAGDFIAWKLMSGRSEEASRAMASYAGSLGGVVSQKQNKEKLALFYDANWQKKHGYKGAGKQNVDSGRLALLNACLTANRPDQRSHAGRLGGKKRILNQRRQKIGFFRPDSLVQKRANLVRWGIIIDNVRIPFEKLSSTFVDYYLVFGTKKKP